LRRNPWTGSERSTINPQGVRALRYGFLAGGNKVIAAPHRPVGRLSSGDEPRRLQGASDMFNDIWIARKNALNLARALMVVTMVIAIGTQFSVITAEDHDSSLTVIHDYDPFEIM
jgi:hypothetical protein